MSETIYGVPLDKIPSLVREIEKASDGWAKLNAMDHHGVDWGDRYKLLWELIRRGDYAAWSDPVVWYELANIYGRDAFTAQDVADFLTRVEHFDELSTSTSDGDSGGDDYADKYYDDEYYEDEYYDDYDDYDGGGYVRPAHEAPRFAEFWPLELDHLAMIAYSQDPEAIESRFDQFSPEIQNGIQLVRFRFQKISADELPDDLLSSLASVHVHRGLPDRILDLKDGELVDLPLNDYSPEGKAGRVEFLERFTTLEAWSRAVLDEVLADLDNFPGFDRTSITWSVATTEELAILLKRSSLYNDALNRAYELLLQRNDTPAELFALAGELQEANKNQEAELIVVTAILKGADSTEDFPADIASRINLQTLQIPNDRKPGPAHQNMVQALQILGEDLALPRLLELFDGRYTRAKPFQVLNAFPDNQAFLDKAFAVVEALATDEYPSSSIMDPAVFGFRTLGQDLVPTLAARWETSDEPLIQDAYHRALLAIFADTGNVPEGMERFVNLTNITSVGDREYDLYSKTAPDYQALLEALPKERALELIIRDTRDFDNPRWARMLIATRFCLEPPLLDVLFQGLAKGLPTKLGNQNWFGELQNLFHQHRETLEPYFGPLLAARQDPEFHNQIKQMFGEDSYKKLLEQAGAEAAADTSGSAKLRRLANAYFTENPEASRTSVYLLERLPDEEEAPDDTLNRLGGRPLGITQWPTKNDDPDLPMTHLFTLDFRSIPKVAAQFQRQAPPPEEKPAFGINFGTTPKFCAVSLFVRNPEYNEAYSPGTDETEVVFLTDKNLDEWSEDLPTGSDEPRGFTVEEVEIPLEAFTVEYDGPEELRNIRNGLYASSAWAGPEPIWLQGEEHFGGFILQFDESFYPMNLGDCGIMYVFSDTAFWQCH